MVSDQTLKLRKVDIVHLTSAHSILDTRIFVKEARALEEAGFIVAVVGPGDATVKRQIDGIQLYSITRPSNRLQRFTSFSLKLYQTVLKIHPKVVHIHDPDLLNMGLFLRRHGIKVVYDVHEDFPQALLSRTWRGPMPIRHIVAWLVRIYENLSAKWLDGLVLADAQISDHIKSNSTVIVRNYLEVGEWSTDVLENNRRAQTLRAIYVGDISEARGLSRMCDAIYTARQMGLEITLDLIGPISNSIRETVGRHPAAPYILLHGWGSRAEVAKMMRESDIAFCLLQPTPAYVDALPVKVLEYIISGLPIVATDLPRLRKEIALAGAFQFVGCNAASEDIVGAIRKAVSINANERSRLQKSVIKNYNWSNEAMKLISFYETLLIR